MTELKTKVNDANVEKFLNSVDDENKRNLSFKVLELMKKITNEEPKMWGPSIVGFGSYHYKYESGREGDMCLVGFSPRKKAVTIYALSGISENDELLAKLGKFKNGKGCIYIKNEKDVDFMILKRIIEKSMKYLKEKYK